MSKLDLKDLKDLKLDSIVEELRQEAGKRGGELFGAGRSSMKGARRAIADPNDGDMFGAFVLGILVGAVVGAAIALVFAPFSGDEVRRRIGRRVEEVKGEAAPEWETHGTAAVRSGNGESVYQTAAATPPETI